MVIPAGEPKTLELVGLAGLALAPESKLWEEVRKLTQKEEKNYPRPQS